MVQSNRKSDAVYAFAAAMPVIIAAVLGSLATKPNLQTWYAQLAKPWFTPPNWVFGPAWTTLYILMTYALWRILRLPGDNPSRRSSIFLFFFQLVLNTAWSFAFFAGRSPLGGLIVIAPLLLAIGVLILMFQKQDKIAALCLAPYFGWVSFATLLNLAVWRLNG